MNIAVEILDLMKSNAEVSAGEIFCVTPEKAAAVAMLFVEREVKKAQMAHRNVQLLNVAARLMAGDPAQLAPLAVMRAKDLILEVAKEREPTDG